MRIGSVGSVWFGLAIALAPAASAQGRVQAFVPATLQPAPDSSATLRPSWSGTGAIVGGVGGSMVFAVAFYHFSHRPANNTTAGTLGGTLVGAAFGAAGGALFGAFVGSLFPKR
jgi:hypothetical protein